MKVQRILFVCMGNICRSPTAEAVARKMDKDMGDTGMFEFDSAGTHGYHIGDAPDPRAIDAGEKRGYDLGPLRARKVMPDDFGRFDLVLAMDEVNYAHLLALCPNQHQPRLKYLLDFAPKGTVREVPDPYYGNRAGFDKVIDLVELGITGLFAELKQWATK